MVCVTKITTSLLWNITFFFNSFLILLIDYNLFTLFLSLYIYKTVESHHVLEISLRYNIPRTVFFLE